MATVVASQPLAFGPWSNGIVLSPRSFDRGRFEEGWRYELINGVLVVSITPDRAERDPNEELGRWLRNYQEDHPDGFHLNLTLHEESVAVGDNRRRADRVVWVGLGRLPRRNETPYYRRRVRFAWPAELDSRL